MFLARLIASMFLAAMKAAEVKRGTSADRDLYLHQQVPIHIERL